MSSAREIAERIVREAQTYSVSTHPLRVEHTGEVETSFLVLAKSFLAAEEWIKELERANGIAAKSYELMQERIRALEACLRDLIETESSEIASWHEARTLLSPAKPICTNPEKKENA